MNGRVRERSSGLNVKCLVVSRRIVSVFYLSFVYSSPLDDPALKHISIVSMEPVHTWVQTAP